jgi:hypothetical protein
MGYKLLERGCQFRVGVVRKRAEIDGGMGGYLEGNVGGIGGVFSLTSWNRL